MKKIIAITALAFAVSACGGANMTQGVTKPAERTGGLFGMNKQDNLKVTTADAFKGVNEVVIGGFVVGFDTYKRDSVKAGGGLMGSGFGGKSTARSKLSGIDDKTMQEITDNAYKNFVAALKANGYKVVDRGQLLAEADFKDTKTYPSPYVEDNGTVLAGGNVTKYFAPSEFGDMRLFPGDVPSATGGFGFSNPMMGAIKYVEKTGQKVLHVVYKVDFANADGYGGWHTNSSSITVGQGLSVVADATKIGIIGGQGGTFSSANGSIALGQSIASDKEFAQVGDATSDTAKGVEVATNVIGALGGIGTNSSREYEFVASPAKYKAASLDAIKQATDALTGQMSSLK